MSNRQQITAFVLGLLASTALSATSDAQQPSGTAVKVSPQADASGTTGARELQAPGDIFQGDVVNTGPRGQAQIEFADETRFVVGANSRVTIDRFVYNPDKTATSVALRATKGTFRFLSGNSPKDAYRVTTPTMTIGVRGSAYNFTVLSNGRTLLQWLEESGYVCVSPPGAGGGRTLCQDLNAGDFVGASPGGGFDSFRPGEVNTFTRLFNSLNTGRGLAPGFGSSVPAGGVGNAPGTGSVPNDDERPDPPEPPDVDTPEPSYP